MKDQIEVGEFLENCGQIIDVESEEVRFFVLALDFEDRVELVELLNKRMYTYNLILSMTAWMKSWLFKNLSTLDPLVST